MEEIENVIDFLKHLLQYYEKIKYNFSLINY